MSDTGEMICHGGISCYKRVIGHVSYTHGAELEIQCYHIENGRQSPEIP